MHCTFNPGNNSTPVHTIPVDSVGLVLRLADRLVEAGVVAAVVVAHPAAVHQLKVTGEGPVRVLYPHVLQPDGVLPAAASGSLARLDQLAVLVVGVDHDLLADLLLDGDDVGEVGGLPLLLGDDVVDAPLRFPGKGRGRLLVEVPVLFGVELPVLVPLFPETRSRLRRTFIVFKPIAFTLICTSANSLIG